MDAMPEGAFDLQRAFSVCVTPFQSENEGMSKKIKRTTRKQRAEQALEARRRADEEERVRRAYEEILRRQLQDRWFWKPYYPYTDTFKLRCRPTPFGVPSLSEGTVVVGPRGLLVLA